MIKKIFTALFALFTIASCEEIVNFPDADHHNPVVVIEAVLTDQLENQYVKVSYSTYVTDTLLGLPVVDATVKLSSEGADTLYFTHEGNGYYQLLTNASVNHEYRLDVTVDGKTYSAYGKTISMNGIDSLYWKRQYNPEISDSSYYVYMNAGDSYPEDTRYYLLNVRKNAHEITSGSEIWVFRDSYTDSINGIKLPAIFEKNDTVMVELNSLSKPVFDYYFKLSYEVFFLNLGNISYRCNLPVMFEPEAMGYFQVSCLSRKNIIIR